MNRQIKCFLIKMLPVAMVCLTASVIAPFLPAQEQSRDEFILEKMKDANVPGLSACIVKKDKLVWSGAFGWADVENKDTDDGGDGPEHRVDLEDDHGNRCHAALGKGEIQAGRRYKRIPCPSPCETRAFRMSPSLSGSFSLTIRPSKTDPRIRRAMPAETRLFL